ncbi:hypothetical protein DUI87_10040 [Hirundo rustica rustica]|uniref:Uncharacterized protein n=1 Tax=Hirundo rustica rustica TaxID=333673 RepID=A0A3M0KNE8_HIRRU|nr:hypothetical protein DUI87_10040 [Hirundo rustica rustica]
MLADEKLNTTPAMCTHSPESQPCPGLHQKQHVQQTEGGDSPPLLCSCETPLVSCIQLQGPQHKKDMYCWSKSRGYRQVNWKAGTLLLWRKDERFGVVQPGEEEALERASSTFQYLHRAARDLEKEFYNGMD